MLSFAKLNAASFLAKSLEHDRRHPAPNGNLLAIAFLKFRHAEAGPGFRRYRLVDVNIVSGKKRSFGGRHCGF